jgi:hypothetical protein
MARSSDKMGAVVALAESEDAERPGYVQPVALGHFLREVPGEMSVCVDLDDELKQPALAAGGVGHREGTHRVGFRNRDVHVLAREELDLGRLDQPQHQVPHVVSDRVPGHHLRDGLLDRQAGADHLLVVVEQLDREVFVGVRPAQQRVAFLELKVGQRERGVLVELDLVAVEDERLAGGALPLLAAVHEHDPLLGRGPQNVLILRYLDLDADRLEADDVLFCHDPLPG